MEERRPVAFELAPKAYGQLAVAVLMFTGFGLWFLLDPSIADEYGLLAAKGIGVASLLMSIYGTAAFIRHSFDDRPILVITTEGVVDRYGLSERRVRWAETKEIYIRIQRLIWPTKLRWVSIRLEQPSEWIARQPILTRILYWLPVVLFRRPIVVNHKVIGRSHEELISILRSYRESWQGSHA